MNNAGAINKILFCTLITIRNAACVKMKIIISLNCQYLDPDVLSNYEPISLTSLVEKFVGIVIKQIVYYVEANEVLVNIQHSFRENGLHLIDIIWLNFAIKLCKILSGT